MSLSADVLCADDRNENSQEAQNFALLVFLSPATKKVRQSPMPVSQNTASSLIPLDSFVPTYKI